MAPSIETAWGWLINQVPPEWRPALGIGAAVAILVWLLMNGLKIIFEVVKAWQDIFRRSKPEVIPPPPATNLPPPRVSVWNSDPQSTVRPRLVSAGGIPIVTVANMKGGVGKTTLTANLAAYLDSQGKRVLLIDLDYQGSLSQTVLAAANMSKMGSVVDDMIIGDKAIGAILEASQTLTPALPNSRLLSCYYEFADTETYEMVRWISGQGDRGNDLRFRMADLLQQPMVKEQFDVVVIDAPPRFSTGTINALCASTHLIIPTVLDQMSAEAVIYFSRDVAAMRSKLFPNLRLIGVVPTLVYQWPKLTARELGIIDHINRSLTTYWGRPKSVLEKAAIPRRNAIGDISGTGIGYVNAGLAANTRQVRDIFERVGKELREQLT